MSDSEQNLQLTFHTECQQGRVVWLQFIQSLYYYYCASDYSQVAKRGDSLHSVSNMVCHATLGFRHMDKRQEREPRKARGDG